MANGAPTVSNGLVISGVTTSTNVTSAIDAIIKNTVHDCELQILATYSNKNSKLLFGDAADDDVGMIDYDHNTNNMKFYVNASQSATIDSSGNLGLNGITSPSSYDGWARQLVLGSTTGHGGLTIVSGNDSGEYGHLLFADGTGGTPDQEGRIGYEHDSNFMYFATNNTERMRLNNSGRIGINEGSPNATLHIKSADAANNRLELVHQNDAANEQNQITFKNNTTQTAYIVSGKDGSNNNIGLSFATGNTVRMNIDASGYIRKFYNPLFVAQKSGAITGTGFQIFNTVIENVGSHYNSSNGKFTAPIAGYYYFIVKINAYKRIDFYISRNGSVSGNTNREIGQFNTSNQDGWYSHNLVRIFELSANDYVMPYVSNIYQNSDPGEWLTFQGYLIQ